MKTIRTIMENAMKPEDTFEFGCSACGACCRNQGIKDNMVSGMDIFRIAQAMGCTTEEVIKKYMNVKCGASTNIPVIYLRVRDDKSCIFLRKGKCLVHNTKPVNCAIFPLGRVVKVGDDKQSIMYFNSGFKCKCGVERESQTLQEWLDEMHVSELDGMSYAWGKLMKTAMLGMQGGYDDELYRATLYELYINFDITQPYEAQAERNNEELTNLFVLKKRNPEFRSSVPFMILHNKEH